MVDRLSVCHAPTSTHEWLPCTLVHNNHYPPHRDINPPPIRASQEAFTLLCHAMPCQTVVFQLALGGSLKLGKDLSTIFDNQLHYLRYIPPTLVSLNNLI